MSIRDQFLLMGQYNQWMNSNLYSVSSSLTKSELTADRGAFFGSILGTLNHILVGDTIWLKRFANHPGQHSALAYLSNVPAPSTLNMTLYSDFSELRSARETMDTAIIQFIEEVKENEFNQPLAYKNTKGQSFVKKFGFLVQHFFNHQTHHRGQVTVLLSQAGCDVGTTDLLVNIPNVE